MSREISTRSSIRRRDFLGNFSVLGSVVVRVLVPQPSSCVGPFRFSGRQHVSLASMIEDRTHAEPAAPQPGGTGPTLLFGVDTEPVADGELPERWRRVKADIARALETVARCHANGPCIAAAPSLIAIVAEGIGHSGRARIAMINRAVNLAITPMSDRRQQWGVPDRWSAPLETLQSSRGDCEDYAIVKYAALLAAGISESDVKIVIFKNLLPKEEHAALAAHVDGQWFILDNRTLTLVSDTDVTRAIPEYVLDQNGVSRFVRTSPTAGRHS